MQSLVILVVTLTIVGFACAAKLTPDEVHAEIQLYARQCSARMRMMRGGSSSMQCYDKYIPEINNMAEQSKNQSQICITSAENEREQEVNQIQSERASLEKQIQSIENSLNNCTALTDIFEYLQCLDNCSESNQLALDEIKRLVSSLNAQLNVVFGAIELEENICIVKAIEDAKNATNVLFDRLQHCLIHGFEDQTAKPEPSEPEQSGEATPEEPEQSGEATPEEPEQSGESVAPIDPAPEPSGETHELPEEDV